MLEIIKEKNLGSSLGKQEIDILIEVIKKKNTLTRGPYLEKFEKIFAKMCGSKYAVAVSSCTAALKISTQLLRLKQGDEVIVQANAFWKTVVALVEKKVLLKIVDVNKNNFQMSFEDLQNKITRWNSPEGMEHKRIKRAEQYKKWIKKVAYFKITEWLTNRLDQWDPNEAGKEIPHRIAYRFINENLRAGI